MRPAATTLTGKRARVALAPLLRPLLLAALFMAATPARSSRVGPVDIDAAELDQSAAARTLLQVWSS